MSAKKSKKTNEGLSPEDLGYPEVSGKVETSEDVKTESTLDDLKKRQDELKAELAEKQAEFKAEMTTKRQALKDELTKKREVLKVEEAKKREALKEERTKERAEKSEKRQRENMAIKIAKMEERHKIAMTKLENLGDTVKTDLAELGLQKGDHVEFIDSKDKDHKMYGELIRFWPYYRSYTTACAIKEDETGKVYTRSVFNVKKTDVIFGE